MTRSRRLLFFGEGVTLSHVVRPAVLAASLDRRRYRPVVACPAAYHHLFASSGLELVDLESADPRRTEERLRRGKPLFDAPTLDRQVSEDLRRIEEHEPDAVIGDLRHSLPISAEIAGVPFLNLVNAHWSPGAETRLELAEHPLVDLLGEGLAQAVFRLTFPMGSALHSLPANAVRAKRGLRRGYELDVRRIYTAGDAVLYPDAEELQPTRELPPHHRYLGPILWSPPVELPPWWKDLDPHRPLIYLNLGSSGAADRLRKIASAVASLPVEVAVATAGRRRLLRVPANVHVAEYLPGDRVAARAALSITNGGVMAAHQSLAAGTPVLGVVSNMDQLLSAKAVRAAGAGEVLRAERVTAGEVERLAALLLGEPRYTEAAGRLARVLAGYDPAARFREAVDEVLGR